VEKTAEVKRPRQTVAPPIQNTDGITIPRHARNPTDNPLALLNIFPGFVSFVSDVLSEEGNQQVIALGKLGWPLWRIEQATGVFRETVRQQALTVERGISWSRHKAARDPGRAT
jgi:hypothetical protein